MNLFLKLPIYERLALLENVSDHDIFLILLSMPEFGFLNKNLKLQARLYKSRLDRYFSHYELFYEENTSWKEIYDRLVILEIDIRTKTKNILKYNTHFYAKSGQLMELKILLSKGILSNQVTANTAGYHNQVKILRWMKENNLEMPDQDSINHAAYKGCLETLKWAKENNYKYYDTGTSDSNGQLIEGLFAFKKNFLANGFLRKSFEIDLK